MKFFLLTIVVLISNFSNGQIRVKEINSYSDLNGTKLLSLMSDNSVWTSNGLDTWTQINTDDLPKNIAIKILGSKSNLNLNKTKTDLILILDDNSIWNLKNGISKWKKIQTQNLPANTNIKAFKTYMKFSGLYDFDTRLVLVLEDNSIWWSDGDTSWEKVIDAGLPSNYNITGFNTYQKASIFNSETRFIVTLADNSFWWYATGQKNWTKITTQNYPKDKTITISEAYMKASIASTEGRIISIFNDNSIMWMATRDCNWNVLSSNELPKNIKITKMNIFSKLNLLGKGTRIILLLENNQIWSWLDENQSWTKVNVIGLPN